MLHSSTLDAIRQVRAAAPAAPFLTLGQTVFWDEPLKAAFFRALRKVDPHARMTGAVHDTDYFAKLPGGVSAQSVGAQNEPFVLLGHNDGDTRGLWSAAGEMACVWGSETVVTRHDLGESGVEVERVAKSYRGGAEALLSHETEAWGWKAIVRSKPGSLIAADVKLADVAPALREQLAWALNQSLCAVESEGAQETARRLQSWLEEYLAAHPDASLADLYEWLTPRLWSLVGGVEECLDTGRSTELFRFNTATCALPRWGFLDLFLNPATRATAIKCYDDAVRGSGIYTLDKFGPGALPFDVVLPANAQGEGGGRGTLRLHRGSVWVQTEAPHEVCAGCDPGSVAELAALLEAEFGPNVALVGKAVALISMLSAEYVFVFHERASGYTVRTQAMNAAMRARGLPLKLHPMVRVTLSAWDALGAATARLQLPPHLATAFGSSDIAASEFSVRWRGVCDEQDALRGELRAARAARALLGLLGQWRGEEWETRLQRYDAARQTLRRAREQTLLLEAQTADLRAQARSHGAEAASLERAKGNDFRLRVQPLRERLFDLNEARARRLVAVGPDEKPFKPSREERAAQRLQDESQAREADDLRARIAALHEERGAFDAQIAAQRETARELSQRALGLVRERAAIERGAAATEARATLSNIESEAQLAKLRLVRDSLWVSRGLRYTDVRPTAWWLPLVSPGGKWFSALVSGAQCRLEEL